MSLTVPAIISSKKHGEKAIAPFLPRVVGARACLEGASSEVILDGTGDQSPFHQWRCTFLLLRSADKKIYALEIVDFGDPNSGFPDEEAICEVVAVWQDPPTKDESLIVRLLLSTYEEHGGKFIDYPHFTGRFTLDEQETDREFVESLTPPAPKKKTSKRGT